MKSQKLNGWVKRSTASVHVEDVLWCGLLPSPQTGRVSRQCSCPGGGGCFVVRPKTSSTVHKVFDAPLPRSSLGVHDPRCDIGRSLLSPLPGQC